MKKFYFVLPLFASISFIVVLSSSCSDKEDDNKMNTIEKEDDNKDDDNKNKEIVSSCEKDGIVMTYCLHNSKNETTVTFSEGEEIIFDLQIENKTEQAIYLPTGPGFLGYNTFRIFTKEGEDCGISWSYPEYWTMEMNYLWPSTPEHYQCPWYSDEIIKATYPFYFQPTAKRLTKGCYYTEAYSNFENEIKLYCKLNFNIE